MNISFSREQLATQTASLAVQGVYVGTSSWKYPGWCGMLYDRVRLPGSRTNADLVAARFLLKPGGRYEQAVKAFEPYNSVKEENQEARAAGRALIAEGQAAGSKRRTFVYVNNRLEGNAISTIAAMVEAATGA